MRITLPDMVRVGAKLAAIVMVLCRTSNYSAADAPNGVSKRLDTRDIPRSGLIAAGLALAAWLDESIVAPGQPVTLKLSLLNVTAEVRYFTDSSPENDFRLIVRQRSAYGLVPIESRWIPPASPGNERAIGAGQTLQYTYQLDRVYDISSVGEYFITASRRVRRTDGSEDAELVSNSVTLLVSEDPRQLQATPPSDGSPAIAIGPRNAERSAAARTKSIMDRRGLVGEGIMLTAVLERPIVASGEAVTIILTLENVSGEVRWYMESSPELDYRLIVLNTQGDQLPSTRDEGLLAVTRNVLRQILPGDKLTYRYRMEREYDVSRAGEYHIIAYRSVPSLDLPLMTDIVSNTVVLTVTPKP